MDPLSQAGKWWAVSASARQRAAGSGRVRAHRGPKSFIVAGMKSSLVALSGLVLAVSVPSLARADVAPEDGYVETCTVEKQQGAGEQCLSCGDAYHGDRDACQRQYAGDGYTKRCQTYGASVWKEVWCKKAAGGSAPAETKTEETAGTSRCSVDGGGGLGGLLAALGLVFVRRRRAR